MQVTRSSMPYVLITPARNEGKFIRGTIESVAAQTLRPEKWVIVNDGSTDDTGEAALEAAKGIDWIEVVNLPVRQERNFAAKVYAFKAGQERLAGIDYKVIGNLDADVTLEKDHFEYLMSKFQEDPDLGVAGTIFREPGYCSETDSFEGQNYVSGQCQIFRRECFEMIGGYTPSKPGGIDWIAVTTARMMGWKTRSFRERCFYHHRVLGTANHNKIGKSFTYGKKDYYMGGHPLWEIFRCTYQLRKRPFVIGGVMLFAGYFTALLTGEKRVVPENLMRFHRREQMMKLKAILSSLVRFKKIDSFGLLPVSQPQRAQQGTADHVQS
ncbi:glycosyltransferase [Occallatibacter savannae]|uniref:glycosyltransferase n=1 Tax=Occallatibacter savannae TaxID=1002691 RepID=UPI000D69B1C1|nr:glycosyltransferase family A protein [Occallatibacter savannae]